MSDLIERLERATGPSRELDEAIMLAVWPEDAGAVAPCFTESLDAAMGLVRPGDGVDTFFVECDCGAWYARFRSHVDELSTRNVAGCKDGAMEFCRQYFRHQAALKARPRTPGSGEVE